MGGYSYCSMGITKKKLNTALHLRGKNFSENIDDLFSFFADEVAEHKVLKFGIRHLTTGLSNPSFSIYETHGYGFLHRHGLYEMLEKLIPDKYLNEAHKKSRKKHSDYEYINQALPLLSPK